MHVMCTAILKKMMVKPDQATADPPMEASPTLEPIVPPQETEKQENPTEDNSLVQKGAIACIKPGPLVRSSTTLFLCIKMNFTNL